MRAVLALLIFQLQLAGCDAYDRDLGPSPYLCGPTEPRCPDGYRCVLEPDGTEVCSKSSASALECADDGAHEPNNTLAEASPAPVSTASPFALAELAICPVSDRDHFAIDLVGASSDLEVTILELSAAGGSLRGAILNTGGVTIAAASETGAIGSRRAIARALPAGRYYAVIEAGTESAHVGNNYELTIAVSTP